jgi:hypothetical protein
MMKQSAHMKIFRDQNLWRDISFLLIAAGFLLHKAFGLPLHNAVMYAPLVVFGIFGGLLGSAHLLLGLISMLEAAGVWLGIRRGPRI